MPGVHPVRERLEAIADAEVHDGRIDVECGTRWWLHAAPAKTIVLALHGYTNNPKQFDVLGAELHADGHDVVALRFPYHGFRDRMTTEIAAMTFDDWARTAVAGVELCARSGGRIVVVGISVTAMAAAWLTAYLPVDHAIALSPFAGVRGLRGPLDAALRAALRTLPDAFVWWDPIHHARDIPPHCYPRFSLHTLERTLRFGDTLAAFRSPAAGRRVTAVLNERDPICSNGIARARLRRLAARGVALEIVARRDFPPRHDVLEPTLPGAPVPAVYGLLRALVRS